MSFLKAVKEKTKELLTVKHPLCNVDLRLKLAYTTGVALLMARADENLVDAERESLESLVYALDLPPDTTAEVLANVQTADEEIMKVFKETLETQEHKLLFLLDLYRAAKADREFSDAEKELIDVFVELLQMEKYREFATSFSSLAEQNEVEKANALVQAAIEAGMEPNIRHLQYFMPDFNYEEIIEEFELGPGQTRTICRPGLLTGKVTVNPGGKLIIKGTSLKFEGADTCINVMGGILELEDSALQATSTSKSPLLFISDKVPDIKITNCRFDGAGVVGILFTSTRMNIINCHFSNSFGAVIFFGMGCSSQLFIEDSIFEHCMTADSASVLDSWGDVSLKNCKFIDCKSSGDKVSGALKVSGSLVASGCVFNDCSTTGIGGAIYSRFGGDKLQLDNCTFTNCSARNGGAIFVDSISLRFSLATGTDTSSNVDISSCVFNNCTPNNIEHKK